MACEAGCTGTPICSALDICCIQFRNDCGKECGGLAAGFGTIQIDVDGNLVVCANVGGICTCTSPVTGTDSLIETPAVPDTSAQFYTHTAVDGVIQTFTLCNQLSVSFNRPPTADDDPCNSSGLGEFCTDAVWVYDPTQPGADTATNGLCVRKWHRVGGNCNTYEWVEQCVPEGVDHVISVAGLENSATQTNANPIPGVFTDFGVPFEVEITNPSDCYDMEILHISGDWQFTVINNGVATSDVQIGFRLILDGVPLPATTEFTERADTGVGELKNFSGGNVRFRDTIGPGVTRTLELQPTYRSFDANFNGSIIQQTMSLTLLGIVNSPCV